MTPSGAFDPMEPDGDPRPLAEILADYEPDVDDDPEMAEVSLEAFFEDLETAAIEFGEGPTFTLGDVIDAIREDRGE